MKKSMKYCNIRQEKYKMFYQKITDVRKLNFFFVIVNHIAALIIVVTLSINRIVSEVLLLFSNI